MNPVNLAIDRLGRAGRPARTQPTVLELDLSHGVRSAPPPSPLAALRQRRTPSMRSIRDGLRKAAADPKVLGLLVHVGACPLTLAEADEIGGLIARFSKVRPSIAWTESFGELSSGLAGYRVAINAREIWLQPSGALGLTGVHLGITLLRGGLEKLGLDPQFSQRHEYKSAADQLAATEITEANREMIQRIADSLLADTTARVAQRRGLDHAAVTSAIERAPLPAPAALEAGLIDRIGYRDEVYAWTRENWPAPSAGQDEGEGAPRFALRYAHRYGKQSVSDQVERVVRRNRPRIAVVDVIGPIIVGAGRPGGGGQAPSDAVTARLRAAGRDPHVKAVLLHVDSPGGSYIASDAIRREVLQLRDSGRPVVAAMGTVAASGGYYVSMGADEIVCQPSTLTGSIGVLAGKLVTERLLDRMGVVHASIDAGPQAAMMASGAPFTEHQWRVLNSWLDEVYADFTGKAATDRGLALAEMEALARGRVWTGVDAAAHRLVDHLGGMDLATDRACALAGVDRDEVQLVSGPPLPFLAGLHPDESSESTGGTQIDLPFGNPWSGGPDALLAAFADWAGLAVPHGVLSLPYRMTVT
ncbi:MAG TPA: signal peptide peptidase SppA [Pseudonocardia sp.]|nr:signal peptide peptidase SppA [Pseudonocardia sp.]